MTVTASLVSGPAGNTALPYLGTSTTTAATVTGSGSLTATVSPTGGNTFASAALKVYLNAPAVAGTYVVKLTPAVTGGTANATAVTLTITVTTIPSADSVAATTTSILNTGETVTATADATVAATKTASTTDAAATIVVGLLNAAGSAAVESYTATISGPGTIGAAATAAATAGGARIAIVKYSDVLGVFPDGNSGVATITISSAAGKVLATETVTFYGSAASLSASTTAKLSKNYLGVAETSTVTIVAKDSAGVARASAGTLTATPASTAIATAAVSGNVVTFTGVKVGTTTVVISDGTNSYTVPVTVIAKTAKTVTLSLDAASYGPGEKATLTVTATDANGNPVADGARSLFGAAVLSNVALNNATLPGTSVTLVDGKATFTFYTPVGSGTLLLTSTEGTDTDNVVAGGTAATIAITTTIANASANAATDAATDAANEATDAANEATDAALAAADAADAATAAAMDASDAVAALSATVAKLVASLKAQITTLTNLVIKIQKKVKA